MGQLMEVDRATLAAALEMARAKVRATNQWAWGNALEKAAEELRAEPQVEGVYCSSYWRAVGRNSAANTSAPSSACEEAMETCDPNPTAARLL